MILPLINLDRITSVVLAGKLSLNSVEVKEVW